MTFQFRMDQVLDFKQHEQELTQKEFNDHQTQFEEIGYELYGILKKKELLQAEQNQRIQTGEQIKSIQQINIYIDQLDQRLKVLQVKLNNARETMNNTHERLITQTIDVKKYEKLKEKQFNRYQQHLYQEEMKHTDEIAVLRHSRNEIR